MKIKPKRITYLRFINGCFKAKEAERAYSKLQPTLTLPLALNLSLSLTLTTDPDPGPEGGGRGGGGEP